MFKQLRVVKPESWPKSENIIVAGFVLALSLGGFLYLPIWKSQGHREDKKSLQQNVDLATRWMNLKISSLNSELRMVLKEEAALRQEINQFDMSPPLGQSIKSTSFLAVGLTAVNAQGVWEAEWMSALNPVQSWGKAEFTKMIPLLPLGEVNEAKTTIVRVSDPSGQPIIAYLKRVVLKQSDSGSSGVVVGLLPINEFASVGLPFKGGSTELLVSDSLGNAFVTPEQQSVGGSLQRHPMWSQYNQLASREEFEFDSESGSNFALVRSIPQTNLLMLASSPLRTLWSYIATFFIPLSVLILALSFSFYAVVRLFKINWGDLQIQSKKASEQSASYSVKQLDLDIAKSAEQKEASIDSVKAIVAGTAYRLQVPLLGILGQSQLAKAKKPSSEVLLHIDFVESEARNLKTQVDQMVKWSENDRASKKPFELSNVISSAVAAFKKLPLANGVRVSDLSVGATGTFVGESESLKNAIVEVLKNAAEAMLDISDKSIVLKASQDAHRVRLMIEDSGRGLTSTQQDKIFDPLYSTKKSGKSVGLGLAVGVAAAKSLGGRLFYEPKLPGATSLGARFVFDLPLPSAPVESFVPPQVPARKVEATLPVIQFEEASVIPDAPPSIDLQAEPPPEIVKPKPEEKQNKEAVQLPTIDVAISDSIEKLNFKVRPPKSAAKNNNLNKDNDL
jgi:signal transduction histidine kinase